MKIKYSIKEVAELFKITTNKIRFYEKKGLITAARDEENNYRYYTENDLMKLQTILMYRLLNIPIEDIEDILKNDYKNNVLNHFYKQWEIINNEVHRAKLIQNSLEEIMDTIYEANDEKYHMSIIESIKKMNEIYKIKENWKDKWDFDGWAKNYDKDVKIDRGSLKIYQNYEMILDTVFRKATDNLDKEVEILEIGVGTGNLANRFLEQGFHITGLDQSREMLNVAKEKFPKLKLRLGEFLKIPFENNTFEIIVSTYAFHHLNDDEKGVAIREMLRILKNDGKIIIGDLMFLNEKQKQKIMGTLTKGQVDEIEDEYYSNIELLKSEFGEYGKTINVLKIDELNFVVEVA
ncbi:methyltransferase domain-containing protein [Clostridium sp. CF012]|uniref:MerR family transcriptional regulator n=1 Tax=Clostridium sp. CF012 TaxID=2843319 RepID=UPI001C0AF574|nr:methyltransferase domain-containing protein [Clostridium sp. CF012]MBU3146053.1 methyltransferase domain-containing protein [Clostridium sp. CF012]